MRYSTWLDTFSTDNVEFARLASELFSLYAYRMFTNGSFGVTVRVVLLGVCRNRATELAIHVEVGGFRRIIEEPNVTFRRVLRR